MSTVDATSADWAVAVFAHNEERNIERCLDSIAAAAAEHPIQCVVLANGCRDDTAAVVGDYQHRYAWVHLVVIDEGDKSNAWNEYVHRLAPPAAIHFFIDGDCRAAPRAFSELAATLHANPFAHAAAALPGSGRNAEFARRALSEEHGLMGNLYALRGDFVNELRRAAVYLPRGLIGDDSLIGALAKWNLDPSQHWNPERVAVAEAARFLFDSLSPFRARDWRTYWTRVVRYRIRAHQISMLEPILKEHGVRSLPLDIRKLYANHLRINEWRGSAIDKVVDFFARRRMDRDAAKLRGQ